MSRKPSHNSSTNTNNTATTTVQRQILRTAPIQNIIRLHELPIIRKELDKAKGPLGDPTCVAIFDKYIAIGTARGITLLFDRSEVIVCIFGRIDDGKARGPVSAVDISPGGEYVAVGHFKGPMVVWDVAGKSTIKAILDASTHTITTVKFAKRDRPVLICVDAVGVVTLFTLNKVLAMWRVEKLFVLQGKAGPVLSCSVLLPNPDFPHLSSHFSLLALATESALFIISLEPNLQVVYQMPREEVDHGVLPHVAWRTLQTRDADISDQASEREKLLVQNPTLVTARGNVVGFIQVAPYEKAEIIEQKPVIPLKFNHMGFLMMDCQVVGSQWLGGQVVAAISSDYKIHVVDPFELAVIDKVELNINNLISHPYFDNSASPTDTADGASKTACDCSIAAIENSLLLLATDKLVECQLLTWSDRVDAYVANGQWIEALALALDFYEGVARAAIGLPRDKASLQNKLRDRMVELIVQYVTLALFSRQEDHNSDGIHVDVNHLKVIGGCALEYCICIDRLDILFTDIYAKFLIVDGSDVLCQLLEPFILNDKLTVLGPDVMPKFLDYFSHPTRLAQLEQCLVHLDPTQLDLELLLPTVKHCRLFNALIYIYNYGLTEFGSPLVECIQTAIIASGFVEKPAAVNGIKDESIPEHPQPNLPPMTLDQRRQCAHQLIVYIQNILAGQSFPSGQLPEDWKFAAKAQLLSMLFSKTCSLKVSIASPSIPLPPYAWLSFLLTLVPSEAFQLIENILNMEVWSEFDPASSPKHHSAADVITVDLSTLPSQQSVFDACTELIVDRTQLNSHIVRLGRGHPCAYEPSADDLLKFYGLAGRLVGYGNVHASAPLVDHIFGNFTRSTNSSKAFNQLKNDTKEAQLQYAYLKAVMDGARECAERESRRLSSKKDKRSARANLSMDITDVSFNAEAHMEKVLKRAGLASTPRVHEIYIRLLCLYNPSAVYLHLISHHDYNIEAILKLCLDREIDEASAYLLERTGDVKGALSLTLKAVDKKIQELQPYVEKYLEEQKDKQNALPSAPVNGENTNTTISRSNTTTIKNTAQTHERNDSNAIALESTAGYAAIHRAIMESISRATQLCIRNEDSEYLWFLLLDRFIQLQRQLKTAQTGSPNTVQTEKTGVIVFAESLSSETFQAINDALISYVRSVLHAMMTHVPLPSILNKITTDHQADELHEFRETIMGMLDTYAYEKNILTTTNELLAIDKYHTIVALRKKRASAFQIRTDTCSFCNLPLNDSAIAWKLLIFDCGHVFHDTCLSREQQQNQMCTLCHRVSSTKKPLPKGRVPDENTDTNKQKSTEKIPKTLTGFKTQEVLSRLEQFEGLIYDTSAYEVFEKYIHNFNLQDPQAGKQIVKLPSVQVSSGRKSKRRPGMLPSSTNISQEITI